MHQAGVSRPFRSAFFDEAVTTSSECAFGPSPTRSREAGDGVAR
ncbi:hypothetical protein F8B43_0943 [Methylorubrum populi]|uniref:Uncharacterized protein n=1 Tax=Methylorubrum populi TaxID=223967 RepID=A0A833N0Q1_9HYPH|nr:hypothetical protein F8B43_0943 [Methylorubrum populi]